MTTTGNLKDVVYKKKKTGKVAKRNRNKRIFRTGKKDFGGTIAKNGIAGPRGGSYDRGSQNAKGAQARL